MRATRYANLVAASYDFSPMILVVDVIEDARHLVNDAGWPTAWPFVGGSFLEAAREGGDAYIPSSIPPATLEVKGSDIAAKSRAS